MLAPRSNYGISRIDQPKKRNHGYYVRITHKGVTRQKYFPDKSSGGKAKALKAAKEYRDSVLARLPKKKQEAAARKKRKTMQSGVTGVTHVISKTTNGKNAYEYWQAAWADKRGKRRTAKFSIGRYGKNKALELAKKARRKSDPKSKPKKAPKRKTSRKKKSRK